MAALANSYSNTAITLNIDTRRELNSANANAAIATQGYPLNHEIVIFGLLDPTMLFPQKAQRFY